MWEDYQRHYMAPDGYVRDPLRDGRVTSEAQSYALLQAAWLRDATTFARVLDWTNTHLRRADGLYSWLWDPAAGGRLIDLNTATDADVDIAFALLIAGVVFDRPSYTEQARALVRAVRMSASLQIGDAWFPAAGNWASAERIINLSYFAPYAYAYFHRLDPYAGWPRAIAVGYHLLEQALAGSRARLPADFAVVTDAGKLVALPPTSALSRAFSFDAIRIPWRLELDCRLFHRREACDRQGLASRLAAIVQRDHRLVTRYSVNGVALSAEESLSSYGALFPAFARLTPALAAEWRRTTLADASLEVLQRSSNRYYDANWVWFGLAAADGVVTSRTPRLTAIR